MAHDVKSTHVVLSWLPGYYWSNGTLQSTGAAVPPTLHMDKETGELIFYVRPIFEGGSNIGLFLKKAGIEAAIAAGKF